MQLMENVSLSLDLNLLFQRNSIKHACMQVKYFQWNCETLLQFQRLGMKKKMKNISLVT